MRPYRRLRQSPTLLVNQPLFTVEDSENKGLFSVRHRQVNNIMTIVDKKSICYKVVCCRVIRRQASVLPAVNCQLTPLSADVDRFTDFFVFHCHYVTIRGVEHRNSQNLGLGT